MAPGCSTITKSELLRFSISALDISLLAISAWPMNPLFDWIDYSAVKCIEDLIQGIH
jgi:hypothetical protein